jgi:predicted esterase
MGYHEFRRFRSQLFQLYQGGEYQQALTVLEQHAQEYSEQEVQTLFWRACLATLCGEPEAALDALEKALDQGYWYRPDTLQGDDDLAALHGEPRFKKLVNSCAERHAQAVQEAKPECRVLFPPVESKPPYPTMMAIHGRYANIHASQAYWECLCQQGWLVGLPQSSQVNGVNSYCWDDQELAVRELQAHFEKLAGEHAVDLQRIILGGFSQGGGLAIWMALRGLLPCAGFIAVAPFLAGIDELSEPTIRANATTMRGYLITGDLDLHQQVFDNLEEAFKAGEIEYQRERHADLDHEFPDDFESSLTEAVKFVLGGKG